MAIRTNGIKLDVIATILGIMVMLGGLVASYASSQAAIDTLQEQHTVLQQEFKEYRERTEQRILEIKLDTTSMSSDLRTIREITQEVKDDLKKLLVRGR